MLDKYCILKMNINFIPNYTSAQFKNGCAQNPQDI